MGMEFPGRIEFVKKILMECLGFEPMDFFCIQMNLVARFVDVSFDSEEHFLLFWDRYKLNSKKAPLKDYAAESLWNRNFRVVTVHMFNPYANDWDIKVFLEKYCDVMDDAVLQRDQLGIWNGKRQFKVLLRQDPKGYDGYKHPPANFSIGPNRGYLFYSGQPQYCRKCMSFGHTEVRCNKVRCRNCEGMGHETKDCLVTKKCNVCGSEEHLFRQCPHKTRSYAEVSRGEEPEHEQQERGNQRGVLGDASEVEERAENEVENKETPSGSGSGPELSSEPDQEEAQQADQEVGREEMVEITEDSTKLNQETDQEDGWMDVDKRSTKRKKEEGNESKVPDKVLSKGKKKAKEEVRIENKNRYEGLKNLPDSDVELKTISTESGSELGSEVGSMLLSPGSPLRVDFELQSKLLNIEEFLDQNQLQRFNETTLVLPGLSAIQEEGARWADQP